MKFHEKLIGDDRFSLEHKIFNVLIILGATLTLYRTIKNYLTELPIYATLFALISFMVFVAIYFYSIKSRNYIPSYLMGIGYLICVYYPGMWILDSGSLGGFQHYLFFFLVVFIVTSPRKEKLLFFYIQWVIIVALIFVEYFRPEFISTYSTGKERLINILLGVSLSMIAIYIALNVFTRMYKGALKTIQNKNDLLEEKNQLILKQQTELQTLNDEKDKLFRIVAHDLKSPFNSILGFCELMNESVDKEGSDHLKRIVSNINTSSEQSFKLVENLLQWASSQQGEIEFSLNTYPMADAIEETIVLLNQQAAAKNITFTCNIEEGCSAFADLHMLRTIVRNLIANAIKYTHEEGEVKLKVQRKDQDLLIEVQDNGVGMSEDKVSKLFRPGQLKSVTGTKGEKGTGFGLLICKDFVEKHNGSISVKSEEGKGTSFFVSLPPK